MFSSKVSFEEFVLRIRKASGVIWSFFQSVAFYSPFKVLRLISMLSFFSKNKRISSQSKL